MNIPRLTRGEGMGQWQGCVSSTSSPVIAFCHCPLCGAICSIKGPVTADGLTIPPVTCIKPGCDFDTPVYLDGWAEMFGELVGDRASVAQADGADA